MTAAVSRRRPSRAERMAKLLAHYDFASLRPPPRIVPVEEIAYAAIRPATLRAPTQFEQGIMVSTAVTMRMQKRAYAARCWLARRLARMAAHEGLAAAWRSSARADLYQFRICNQRLKTAACKVCGCGRHYTFSMWRELPLVGSMEGVEMRNCACGSTLGVEIAS